MRIGLRALGVTVALLAFTPPAAGAKDYAQTALNIIPSGQWGGLPVPAGADSQALMYDGLTPLFDQVSDSDLDTYFKSEVFGSRPRRPGDDRAGAPPRGDDRARSLQRPPHHRPDPRRRHLGGRLDRRRGPRPARRAGPLQRARRRDRRPRRDRDQPDSRLALVHPEPGNRGRGRQADPRCSRTPARRGERVLHDIDVYISGINDYIALRRARRRAVDAQRRVRAQRAQGPVPRPGRRRRGAALRSSSAGLQGRLGGEEGTEASSTTCASSRTPSCRPRSTAGSPTARSPKKAKGNAIIDPGSFEPARPAPERCARPGPSRRRPRTP